jgi:signal transduction histidine kinase/ActR/RegA family two-component response regulator
MEKRYITRSGKIVWTNLNASMLKQSDDTVYFLGIIENITERRQVEEQLRESQKLESLGVLAGGIAHDFNNLLTGILGNASLGLDIAPPGSPMRPLLESLVKASERAADLTRQLLAYAGKGRFVLKSIDLSSAVQEISSLVRASVPGHVHLELKLTPDLTAIEADPAQIQQVIMNLLLNAAESIEPGREGRVTVITSERLATESELRGMLSSGNSQPGTYAELDVSDNGCGMDSATQERMFEPFYTTKFTGRGLGLSAVLGIVRSSGGALNVESQQGTGTRIRILLPTTTKVAPEKRPEVQQDLKGSGTVLVVDDEPMVLSLARSTLERAGYRVLTANGGAEAEEIFTRRDGKIDVVILDVTMPGMNGEEAFRRLKALRADVPVVLSSGHSEDETVSRFQGSGLAGFLQKPYSASQLAEKVRSTLPVTVKTC